MTAVELLLWGKAGRKRSPSSLLLRCAVLDPVQSCPAVMGCRLSPTRCFSCLLSSLGVRCECSPNAKTVCVWMRASESGAVPTCHSINLSLLLPVSFFPCHAQHSLSLSFPPTLSFYHALSLCLLISHCWLREQSTSLGRPANPSVWEWVMSRQPRPE